MKFVHVQHLEAGEGIGYGSTYITPEPMTIATIPVGYADGYPRSLSNRGTVLIQGTRCSVVGRICMDQFMVAVPDTITVKPGDKVVLLGSQGHESISALEIAALASTIPYESSVASLIACHDNIYKTKRMIRILLTSSIIAKAPPKIRWCFYSPIPYTYGLCVLCVLCVNASCLTTFAVTYAGYKVLFTNVLVVIRPLATPICSTLFDYQMVTTFVTKFYQVKPVKRVKPHAKRCIMPKMA